MKELPKVVRDFLTSAERDKVVLDLTNKYHLHADQAGEFERAFILMLLGVERPEEFVASLSATGLTSDVINGLASDLNERVFIPLRNAELKPPAQKPQKPDPLPPPSIEYQPPQNLPGSSAPVPVAVPVVSTATPAVVPQPAEHPSQAAHAAPANWHPAAAVHIYVPSGASHHAVQPVPVVTSPTPAPAVPEPERREEIPTAFRAPAPAPAPKAYSSDPYREPI